jgi:hypothetical protein
MLTLRTTYPQPAAVSQVQKVPLRQEAAATPVLASDVVTFGSGKNQSKAPPPLTVYELVTDALEALENGTYKDRRSVLDFVYGDEEEEVRPVREYLQRVQSLASKTGDEIILELLSQELREHVPQRVILELGLQEEFYPKEPFIEAFFGQFVDDLQALQEALPQKTPEGIFQAFLNKTGGQAEDYKPLMEALQDFEKSKKAIGLKEKNLTKAQRLIWRANGLAESYIQRTTNHFEAVAASHFSEEEKSTEAFIESVRDYKRAYILQNIAQALPLAVKKAREAANEIRRSKKEAFLFEEYVRWGLTRLFHQRGKYKQENMLAWNMLFYITMAKEGTPLHYPVRQPKNFPQAYYDLVEERDERARRKAEKNKQDKNPSEGDGDA